MHCTNDEKRDGGCSMFEVCKFEDSGNIDECLFYQTDNECSDCGGDLNIEDDCNCADENDLYECSCCWGLFFESELDRNDECETCADDNEDND